MLNLFSKGSSMKALAADLAKLRTRRSQIAKDIDHAGDTITLLRSKSKKLVLEGADRKAVTDAEDAVGAAERHERNLTAALETLDDQIEKDEQELLAVQDRQHETRPTPLCEGTPTDSQMRPRRSSRRSSDPLKLLVSLPQLSQRRGVYSFA
jgi:chromosome segregation ATPase